MLVVKKKPLTPNIIWDATNGCVLCRFDKKGIIETNDTALVKTLKAMGHEVIGDVSGEDVKGDVDAVVDGETPKANRRSRK